MPDSCPDCKGTGVIRIRCERISGTEAVYETCRTCKGARNNDTHEQMEPLVLT